MENKDKPKLDLGANAAITFDNNPHELAAWEADIIEAVSHGLALQHQQEHPTVHQDDWGWGDDIGEPGTVEIIPATVSHISHMPEKSLTDLVGALQLLRSGYGNKKQSEAHDGNKSSAEKLPSKQEIDKWLEENTRFDKEEQLYFSIKIDENDEFARQYSELLIKGMIENSNLALPDDRRDFDQTVAVTGGLGPMSNSFAYELIDQKFCGIVAERPDLFPDLAYDEILLEAMINASSLARLQQEYNLGNVFRDVDWGVIADFMIGKNQAVEFMHALNAKRYQIPAVLTLEQIVMLFNQCPLHEMTSFMQDRGSEMLAERYGAALLVKEFDQLGLTNFAFKTGLAEKLSEDELYRFAHGGTWRVSAILQNVSRIGCMQSEGAIARFIEQFPDADLSYLSCADKSEQLQVAIFNRIKETLTNDSSLYYILKSVYDFTDLDEVSHRYLIEHCKEAIGRLDSLGAAKQMFTEIGASPAIITELVVVFGDMFAEREARRDRIREDNRARYDRREAEESYFDNESVTLMLADPGVALSPDMLAEHFESDHVVRMAPSLRDQVHDDTRTNIIHSRDKHAQVTMSEIEMLRVYSARVESALKAHDNQGIENLKLRSLYENLTFIGDKDYEEAVGSIATYWKYILERDPKLQLLVHAGISSSNKVKSDMYMFDRILSYFSDEELTRYNSRLVIDEQQIVNADPDHLKVVLLDDWTISGTQLQVAAINFVSRNQDFERCVEVQLIAASKERIALGLEKVSYMKEGVRNEEVPIPVRAYYMAHDAPLLREDNAKGVHITGAHSSVDYGFDFLVHDIGRDLQRSLSYDGDLLQNLPLTNIVRPYRLEGFTLGNIERFKQAARQSQMAPSGGRNG